MSRRTKILLGACLSLALAGGLLQTPLLSTTRRKLWDLTVTTVGRWWGIRAETDDAQYLDQLTQLQVENIHLKGELADYTVLRLQLKQPASASLRTIQAVVAGAPVDIFRTHLLLNRGALDGVVMGAPVVIEGSILVGFISELSEHTAVCRLLFNPDTSIPAEILAAQHARGLLSGDLYTSVILTTIPRDARLEVGQSVVTVAQGITPPALVVGVVERIYNEENEAYQEARIKVHYDPDTLRGVTILVPP